MLLINSQYHDTTRVIRSVSDKANLNWRHNFMPSIDELFTQLVANYVVISK